MTHEEAPETAAQQRAMILATFFDFDGDDDDGERMLALIEHCRIDLSACNGDVRQLPKVILGHYRVSRGHYDLDRVARDLLTYPPIAARIKELEAQKRRARKR